MRSLPQPRYSKSRTWKRIWRSIIQAFSVSYISDSSAFIKYKPKNRTRVRKSRFFKNNTTRDRFRSKVGKKLVDSAVTVIDENNGTLIEKIDYFGNFWKSITKKIWKTNYNDDYVVNDKNKNNKLSAHKSSMTFNLVI